MTGTVTTVHIIVPGGIDDPDQLSGGNVYDRRICRELSAIGWSVRPYAVPGPWPHRDPAALACLSDVLSGLPGGAVVLLDGLIASTAPEALVPQADRLRLVILMHMPLGDRPPGDDATTARDRERAALSVAVAVIATSAWTRSWLLEHYGLQAGRVQIAEPGVDLADIVPGTAAGGELLCVAAVTPDKGHDVLLAALGMVSHLPWFCTCVGSLHRDPEFADQVRRDAEERRIGDRVRFTGALAGDALAVAYRAADVMVLPTLRESYGMVVTEALARGIPVIAAAVGGLPQALGLGPDGVPPGLLVAPGDPAALAGALLAWLSDDDLREQLRHSARERRVALSGWPVTAGRISGVLAQTMV